MAYVLRGFGIGLKQTQQRQRLRGFGVTDKPPVDIGEAWKASFTGINKNSGIGGPTLEIPTNTAAKCCFCIPVFAKTSGGTNYENDQSAVREGFGDFIDSVSMELQKDGVAVATLTDSTYGTYFPYKFHVKDSINYVGYLFNWQSVLSAFGVGTYQVRYVLTDINTNELETYSFPFDLKVYSALGVDSTVRIDFTQNQIFGNWKSPDQFVNLVGVEWFNQLRLPSSMFSYPTTTYEKERYRQSNGVSVPVENNQEPIYRLLVEALPYWMHDFIKVELLTSDAIYITDYNSTNPAGAGQIVDLGVDHEGDYEPQWDGDAQEVPVEVEFRLRQNNLRARFC